MRRRRDEAGRDPGGSGAFAACILFADMAGYTRRVNLDEQGTLDFMDRVFEMTRRICGHFRGRLIKTTGDGVVLTFRSAGDAVAYGLEMHRRVARLQIGVRDPARFRVGIHAGSIQERAGDIYGHAVNVAARLEAEAAPGTCTISGTVHAQLPPSPTTTIEALGAPVLKNVLERVPLYRIRDIGGETDPDAGRTLRLNAAGRLGLQRNGTALPLPASLHMRGLIGYLALCQGARERNERLCSLLWPDRDPLAARRALLAMLRRYRPAMAELHPDLLQFDRDWAGLDTLRFDSDLEFMEQEVRRGRIPHRLIHEPDWPARILEGFEALGPVFASWLEVQRDSWRERMTRALEMLIEAHDPAREAVADAASALLLLEPGHEPASAARIRHCIAHGRRDKAREEYARIERYLAERFATVPGDALKSAIAAAHRPVRAAEGTGGGGTSGPRPPRRLLRLAVEDFADADGRVMAFRDDLLSNLARFRDWYVLETRASAAEGEAETPDRADYRIAGRLNPRGQLVLSLRAGTEARVIWHEALSLDAADWSENQRQIIGKIAAAIEVYVSADRLTRLVHAGAGDATLHDQWLQGHSTFLRWTPEAAETARGIFRGIIARDPGFAPAYASLAGISNVQHIVTPGRPRDAETTREAEGLAARAVEIDPTDARNHRQVAWAAALNGAFDRAAIHLDLAATLNPASPLTLCSCAMGFAWFGESERASSLVDRMLAISVSLPGWQWAYIASVHFFAGRLEAALRAAGVAGDAIIDNPGWMAATLARMGHVGEARAAFSRLVANVAPVWAGEGPASPAAVRDWFTSAYPIRREEDRAMLAEALAGLA